MNIHEYQAKKLLKKYKIKIPNGAIAYTPSEALSRAQKISKTGPFVLKAQIQSGARKAGHFTSDNTKNLSGICIVQKLNDIPLFAEKMIGNTLVTPQTGKEGKLVSKIYIEEFCVAKRTFYLSFVINRIKACITLLVSRATDNIVELAKNDPKSILRIHFHLNHRVQKKRYTTNFKIFEFE
jgi:succinyl-CoA synthetase beta subunit